MHAHKCKGCGTKFYHSDEMRGNVEAHKCPLCGKTEWEQFAPENAKLPNFVQQAFEGSKQAGLASFSENFGNIALVLLYTASLVCAGIILYRTIRGEGGITSA